MFKRFIVLLAVALAILVPAGVISAQGPTPTPTASGLGGFLGGSQSAITPTPAKTDPVTETLSKDNYVVISTGTWYDDTGKPSTNSVHVFMLAAGTEPKGDVAIKQIASGFAALRSTYPNATLFHVLLLSGPNIYDAWTTSNALQLLSTNLVTPDAFIKDVLNGMKTISLVGISTSASATATRTATARPVSQATATRAPTRVPTTSSNTCNAPADKARLWVKNGYSGTMRFTIGAPDVGFQKDYDIPADSQYHYVDLPPSSKYTYSASIPGVGKASARLLDALRITTLSGGQCYFLTFTP